jgi:hypothetical protein
MFLPWAGYFDIMARSDTFIMLDNVQYTKADWRNRNRIKTSDSVVWLTVPVHSRGHLDKNINEIKIDNGSQWKNKHRASLEHSYKRAPFYDEVMELLGDAYSESHTLLVDLNMDLLRRVVQYLSLDTKIMMSSDMPSSGTKSERLISLLNEVGAKRYLSGPAAKSYLREDTFGAEGIEVVWHDYRHPYYNQQWMKRQGFVSHLSVIDLLFNHGPDSLEIITGKTQIPRPDWVKIRNANDMESTAAERAR